MKNYFFAFLFIISIATKESYSQGNSPQDPYASLYGLYAPEYYDDPYYYPEYGAYPYYYGGEGGGIYYEGYNPRYYHHFDHYSHHFHDNTHHSRGEFHGGARRR